MMMPTRGWVISALVEIIAVGGRQGDQVVLSAADDWLTYPRLTGKKRLMTSADWGGGDIRLHHKWWLSHLPKSPGRAKDGKLANWWKYAVEFSKYEESR